MKSKASKVSDKSSKNFSGKFLNFGINGTSQSKKAVPPILFYFLAFAALGLPNLVFSGVSWFDTLHIMKWTAAMVPIALISAVGGIMTALYGSERTGFRIDLFGWLWLIMLGYISVQPSWTSIISWSTYMKE